MDSLLSDEELLTRLKQGLKPEAPAEASASPEAATMTTDASIDTNRSEADPTIEEALINRADFAKHQMSRFMICDRYIDATKEQKKNFFCDAFTEMTESFELIDTWGSTVTVDAYEGNVEMVGEAVLFAELLGITQVDLLGEVLID